jgi:hypothetical protein
VENLKKWIKLTAAVLFLIMGGAGCMSSESKVVDHLEKVYAEEFEVESTKEGSDIFPEMYGKDKVIAHPEGKPELVFIAGESRNEAGVFYDTYVLSKWSKELDAKYSDQIKSDFGQEVEYKTLLLAQGDKYDPSMIDIPFSQYVTENKEVDVTVKIAIKTDGEPDISKYAEPVYNLLETLKKENTKFYGVSVGFVDESEDISDYIRTSNINNIPWSNLKANVYGTIMVDNLTGINSPDEIAQHYDKSEG